MANRRTFASAAALLLCASTAVAQAPANDDCSNALAVGLGLTAFDSTAAIDSGLDQPGATCGFVGEIYADVWFTFTPGSTDSFDLEVVNNGSGTFDTKMTVYDHTGGACPPLVGNIVDCDDDDGELGFSKVTTMLTNGTPYLVRVGSFGAGTFEVPAALSIAVTPLPPAAPANDDCVNSSAVLLGNTPFDTTAATDGTGLALDPMVCTFGIPDEQIYQDIWFTFTPTATNAFDIASVNGGGISFDSRIAIYDQVGCPDVPASVIACDDDSGPFNEAAISAVPMTIGTSYLIRLGSFGPLSTERPAELSISARPTPPANDDCVNASAVLFGNTPFDTTNATDGTGLALDPLVCDFVFGDDQIYQDVWFTFTPMTTDFYDIGSVNGGGPTFDSRIAVYDQVGCPDAPANVIACDDDDGPLNEALVRGASLTAGVNYLIRVGSFSETTSEAPAELEISIGVVPPSPPANDDCANATVLTAFGTYAFDNSLATTDGASLLGNCLFNQFDVDGLAFNDVWFQYTPTVSGCTYISTLGLAGFDTRLAIYDTSTCPADPALVLACSDDEVQPVAGPFEAGLDVELTASTTYLIRLGQYDTAFTVGGAGFLFISAGPVAFGNDGGGQIGAPGCAPPPALPHVLHWRRRRPNGLYGLPV